MLDEPKLPSLLSPDIKKKLISANDARSLMVKSVRGLDSKLAEVSRSIQTAARRGDTRCEIYSLQSTRSTSTAMERLDNMGRVLMEALRYAGYNAKLKEFRTSDSCMLYILADWSEIMEETKPKAASEFADGAQIKENREIGLDGADNPARPPRRPRPAAGSRPQSPKTPKPADAEVAEEVASSSDNDNSDDDGSSGSGEALGADAEVKTKKFDRSKLGVAGKKPVDHQSSASPQAEQPKASAAEPGASAASSAAQARASAPAPAAAKVSAPARRSQLDPTKIERWAAPYAYSDEPGGEHFPIILPVVMPAQGYAN